LVPEISLTFIASGREGQGNSDQVREVVNQLSNGGSRSVYGIIDWDLTNVGNEHVKVLGPGARYSIENFLLDPLLVGVFLLREKSIGRDDLKLTDQETFLSVNSLEQARLQYIAELVVAKTEIHLPPPIERVLKLKCKYIGGQEVELPRWFLHTKGHELEQGLKAAFPPLRRFTKEAELKKAILVKVIDDLPQLIPQEFLPLFESIQNFPDRLLSQE
jgi:hypothetical protein